LATSANPTRVWISPNLLKEGKANLLEALGPFRRQDLSVSKIHQPAFWPKSSAWRAKPVGEQQQPDIGLAPFGRIAKRALAAPPIQAQADRTLSDCINFTTAPSEKDSSASTSQKGAEGQGSDTMAEGR
jgi:hypothetical protein